jgi:hypothetical protein
MTKICFLDIDGVMNSRQYILAVKDLFDVPSRQMDPLAIDRLNKITDATGASIVVSSTWRVPFLHSAQGVDMLAELMAGYGITGSVVGMTPDHISQVGFYGTRANEILTWIKDNPPVDAYIAIDDERMTDLDPNQIKTEFETGLMDHHIAQAIQLLGKK